ncbi:MAG: mandelate racemase/muconate lactonizing enzyme family protein [Caldilineaceae bacterium]
MKISKIDTYQVVVPMRPGTVHSPQWGKAEFDEVPKFILKVHTDSGLFGIGETYRGATQAEVASAIAALLGCDPLRLPLTHLPIPANSAYDGFEIAIFDLVGKALGLPVHQLLGGAHRDRVKVDYWCGQKTPEDIAQTAREGWAKGFKGLKMKCTLEDPMVERVKAIAAAVPEMKITIDPNFRFYRPGATLELARQMEGYNIEVYEDPTPRTDLEWYVFMRRELNKLNIPLALHLTRPQDVLAALAKDCVDCFNLNGCMVEFVRMAYIADAAGKPVWHGSGVDLGILDMAYIHACSAAKGCTMASDIIGNFFREDDLIVEPIRYEDGYALVPQVPGLGVELDEAAVERYRV